MNELADAFAVSREHVNDESRTAVSEAEPERLWRRAAKDTEIDHVLVLGCQRKAVMPSVMPDLGIGSFLKTEQKDVRRAWINVLENRTSLRDRF